ncbi:MAG TPA: carboxypeptidase-like regulatory domain-containing protein [Solirubrobacterales bacterium]|nr:carboxypeptidase-like regulatory domain-containing protein [Solirubrobacterales bacterium]
MSGTRGGLGRIVAMGVALAVALVLLLAGEARAGKYAVAQCGWYVGADASWADTTGGAKFRPDAFCVPGPGADPFDGVHLKSFTRDSQGTVSGTRFARWRWVAPPGTGITQVRGTWWHTLHDGIEQRIGVGTAAGGFDPFLSASSTDVTPRDFVAGFATPMPALEDRLLCARAESKWCSLEPGSWSALRALTITLEDDSPPAAGIGGELLNPGWHRGPQAIVFWGGELGAGIRYGETLIDGNRVNLTEYPCAIALIGGEWRGTQMQPCPLGPSGLAAIDTGRFSDGPHAIHHCVVDFAGNGACTGDHPVLIDNNPPAHLRAPTLAAGEGWHRVNDFDLSWTNPDQGPASPIAGAAWRLTGPAGYDSGVRFAAGRDRGALNDLSVPATGSYSLQVWLRDEAGNEAPSSAVAVPLRLDDVPPGVAFAAGEGDGVPQWLQADVTDAHSGPAGGTIFYRRLDAEGWAELPTRLVRGNDPSVAHLMAATPDLGPGTYLLRADAVDAAGNTVSSTRRADGTQMAIRKTPPPPSPKPAPVQRSKTRLFARLRGGHGRGDSLTVAFGAPALLSGRLTRADGAGIAGRELRVVSRPSRGALAPAGIETVRTGERGGFELRLPPGPSRRLTVSFPGDGGLEAASRPVLELRVRAGVSLHAAPAALRTGEVLHLSGRVRGRGAPIPRRGKLVAVQYLEQATHRWRPVLVTRSDHSGRFRARYRFRYIEGTASIRLRASALAEERWPYAPGSSRPVTIEVHGTEGAASAGR